MIKSSYSRITDYLKSKPGQYVTIQQIRNDVFFGGASWGNSAVRAIQDLKASGRVQLSVNGDLRINQ